MSASYKPISWNRNKLVYDAALVGGSAVYLLVFLLAAPALSDAVRSVDGAILRMRAFGSLAFILLTVVLAIGPLARLDRRFLTLLYNRRHFGVITAIVAMAHASAVLGWYFAFSPTPQLVALFTANTSFDRVAGFPFELFGIFALLVLAVMAVTSHDFWLSFLTPGVWKALHMSVYAAYGAVVLHVVLGPAQGAGDGLLVGLVAGSVVLLAGLHVITGGRERRADDAASPPAPEPGWIVVGDLAEIAEARAIVGAAPGASGSPSSAPRAGCWRSRTSAPTRTARWARARWCSASSPAPGTATSTGRRTAARRRPSASGSPAIVSRWTAAGSWWRPRRSRSAPGWNRWRSRRSCSGRPQRPHRRAPPREKRDDPRRARSRLLRRILPQGARSASPLRLGVRRGLHRRSRSGGLRAPLSPDHPGSGGYAGLPAPGRLTGVLETRPYPILRIPAAEGVPARAVMLAGQSKVGVQDPAAALAGRLVDASGVMVRRGDLDMLLVGGPIGLKAAETGSAGAAAPEAPVPLGRWRITGEICDGKCAAGAMRPGTGLAHKACANLCITGGVPPVFVSTAPVEGAGFLLLAGRDGGPLPASVLDRTGERVAVEGSVERRDDLLVLRVERVLP